MAKFFGIYCASGLTQHHDFIINKFKAEDLTQLQKSAKQHIVDKIPKSGLLEKAQQEALETIGLMEQIVQTIGWTLDYSALELEEFTQKQIECA